MTKEIEAANLPADNGKIELTDQQIDNYFDSRGEENIEVEQKEEKKEVQSIEEKLPIEEKKEEKIEEEKIDDRKVPYGALHEERSKRKELQRKVETMEEAFKKVIEKVSGQEKPEISYEEDPLAYLKDKTEQQDAFIKEQEKGKKELEEYRNLSNKYESHRDDFAKNNPDFQAAFNHLAHSRIDEYLALGYSAEQARIGFNVEQKAIIEKAFSDEANPAERFYNLAKLRGYQKPLPKLLENNGQSNTDKLDMLKKGIKAASSIDNISGGKPSDTNGLNLAKVADIIAQGGDAFDKLWADFESEAKKGQKQAF